MRIVGGELSGRRFEPPVKGPARPTTDRAREGLFNILEHSFPPAGKRVLDLFAGSGGLSYEALSRGATTVVAVEKHRDYAGFIKKTAGVFGLSEQLTVHTADVLKFLARAGGQTFDLVFADPPYEMPGMATLPDLILESGIVAAGGMLLFEHRSRTQDFQKHPLFLREAIYGEATFTFFSLPA